MGHWSGADPPSRETVINMRTTVSHFTMMVNCISYKDLISNERGNIKNGGKGRKETGTIVKDNVPQETDGVPALIALHS